MERPITTKQHAFIDYVTSAMLPILSKALEPRTSTRTLLSGVAAMTTGQTVITDFEGGKVGLIPMQAHLTADAMIGVGLLGAAVLMKNETPAVRMVLAGLGVFSIAAAALTDPIPEGKGRTFAERTAEKVRQMAGRTAGELAGA